MVLIEPSAQQHRAAAFALVVIAILTGVMIAAVWVDLPVGPYMLPLALAYVLFNFGFVGVWARGSLKTKGARLGITAVLLNFAAMLLNGFQLVWSALSGAALVVAVIAGYMLFTDARTSGA
jgi:hypothetical protein